MEEQETINYFRSFTEYEYRALRSITYEIIWILKILCDLGTKGLTNVSVWCDNDSAIKLALNHVFHEKMKYFEVDLHFVREKVLSGILKIVKINYSNQNADLLTKSKAYISTTQHEFLMQKIGFVDIFNKD